MNNEIFREKLKTLTLLYVEDELLIRQNAVEYLSRMCKEVYQAEDGLVGLEQYEKHKPDIIITDIKMPKMDGLAFAKEVRKSDKETLIIIATAYTETEYLLQAVELQLIKYISKPIAFDKLNEALALACEYRDETYSSMLTISANVCYDTLNQTLLVNNSIVNLTHNEALLFNFLVKNQHRAIHYEEIESLIWAYEGMSMDALRSLVRGLRKKLQDDYIDNISGVGYRLKLG